MILPDEFSFGDTHGTHKRAGGNRMAPKEPSIQD
jgi:hypothetical protein